MTEAHDKPTPPAEYPCPCCGYLVFKEEPGSYDICPICFWEDDLVQLRFPFEGGGANRASLVDAQKNFLEFGACELRLRQYTRAPLEADERDAELHPVDENLDPVEREDDEASGPGRYPRDGTRLYYWRDTFWRRNPDPSRERASDDAPN